MIIFISLFKELLEESSSLLQTLVLCFKFLHRICIFFPSLSTICFLTAIYPPILSLLSICGHSLILIPIGWDPLLHGFDFRLGPLWCWPKITWPRHFTSLWSKAHLEALQKMCSTPHLQEFAPNVALCTRSAESNRLQVWCGAHLYKKGKGEGGCRTSP
jgi:hypothetical protein